MSKRRITSNSKPKRNANTQTFLSTVNKSREKEKKQLKKDISKEYEKINVLAKEQKKYIHDINDDKTDSATSTWRKYQNCIASIRQCRSTIVKKNNAISKIKHIHGGYISASTKSRIKTIKTKKH
jgi:hypothetical protein